MILPSTVDECDRLLLGLAALASVVALPIARASAAVVRREAWRAFGYLNQSDFTRERLQRSPRWPREQARLHTVLEQYPRLAEAFCGADGGEPLGQVATIEIGRAATADTLLCWINRARTQPLHELRAAAAEARRAQTESDGANRGSHSAEESNSDSRSADAGEGDAAASLGRSIAAELEQEESEENRVLVRRSIPPDVKLIFESGLGLFGNHDGGDASLAGFVQALEGEASSVGVVPPEDFRPRLRRLGASNRGRAAFRQRVKPLGRGVAPKAKDLRQSRALQTPAMRQARQCLVEFDQVRQRLVRFEGKFAAWDAEDRAGGMGTSPGDLKRGDDNAGRTDGRKKPRARVRALRRLVGVLQSLVRLEGRIAIDMAALLLEMHEHRAWELLGYSGLESYVENRLGLGASMARQRVALAREIRRYGYVSTAYQGREIGFVATQWVARTLRPTRGEPSLQARWVRHAKERTVKRLRDESSALGSTLLEAQVAIAEAMTSRLGVQDQSVNRNPSADGSTGDNRNPST
ncbi:MAG TPA: hypothetical protein VFD07_13370, partial [Candidatus Krumholzibacteria bacterium]|nr:hypothetical protein [Candidatus Krumholzibacteria bacterium]